MDAANTERPHPPAIAHWLSRLSTASARVASAAEVEGFRSAQRMAFECAEAAAKELRPGCTEGQTSRRMLRWFRERGVCAFLHKPIVAFGSRTLAPTEEWGPARGEGATLREGDVVILDCSPIVGGYTGDAAYTFSVGPNPRLEEAQRFLAELRSRLPARFADPEAAADVFRWVDREIRAAGYENAADGYVNSVIGHRVYRHGRYFSRASWFPSERIFGWTISWHGPGFLTKTISRLLYPETLGPLHQGPKTGVWAIEPHLRAGDFGCKFEELLIVEEGRAYWLDDLGQKRIEIGVRR